MVIKAPAGAQLCVPHPDEVAPPNFWVCILRSVRPSFAELSFGRILLTVKSACLLSGSQKLCIHVVSRDGPIEVFLCPEHPDSDHQKAHTHGNHAPFQAASPSLQRDAKGTRTSKFYSPSKHHLHPLFSSDQSSASSDPGLVGSPQARDPRQSPAATSPSSQPLAQDQQDQIFVSLASNLTCSLGGKEEMPSAMEDQGISDLFHMEQAPLELPF